MQVYLAPRNRAQLDRLLEALQDPSSPRLPSLAVGRRVRARASDRRRRTSTRSADWLVREGFRVTFASASRGAHLVRGHRRDRGAVVPRPDRGQPGREVLRQRRRSDGAGVARREDQLRGRPRQPERQPHEAPRSRSPSTTSSTSRTSARPTCGRTTTRSRSSMPAMDGSGQCIAVLNGSDVDQESLALFNDFFGLPPFTPGGNYDVVYPDGPPGIAPPLAERRVGGLWRGDPRRRMVARDRARRADRALRGQLPGARRPRAWSTRSSRRRPTTAAPSSPSAGRSAACRSRSSSMLDNYYRRGAAQGQTIFVATGDVGVAGPTLFNRQDGRLPDPEEAHHRGERRLAERHRRRRDRHPGRAVRRRRPQRRRRRARRGGLALQHPELPPVRDHRRRERRLQEAEVPEGHQERQVQEARGARHLSRRRQPRRPRILAMPRHRPAHRRWLDGVAELHDRRRHQHRPAAVGRHHRHHPADPRGRRARGRHQATRRRRARRQHQSPALLHGKGEPRRTSPRSASAT